jgi:predicted HAD superfamily hydrolase
MNYFVITAATSARRKSDATTKVEVQAMLSLLEAQVDLDEPTGAGECDAKAATSTVEITSGGDEYVVPFVSADHRSHWVLAYRTALDSAAALADC